MRAENRDVGCAWQRKNLGLHVGGLESLIVLCSSLTVIQVSSPHPTTPRFILFWSLPLPKYDVGFDYLMNSLPVLSIFKSWDSSWKTCWDSESNFKKLNYFPSPMCVLRWHTAMYTEWKKKNQLSSALNYFHVPEKAMLVL